MSLHLAAFALDPVRGTRLFVGEFDPSTYQVTDVNGNPQTVGVAAALGSLFIQVDTSGSTAALWLKTGTAATAWTTIDIGALTQSAADGRYLRLTGGTVTGAVALNGDATVNSARVAKVQWSTSAPSGTPAGGTGTIHVQY